MLSAISTKEKGVTMDTLFTRFEEASHAGDVNSLRELLKEDKLLLERVITSTSVRDNPLHIAAILGHAAFAHELICRKLELAMELNGQGMSPLHLAAAHGHVAVVKELLKADFSLCLLREKQEGLLPLHVAIMKGRAAIVKVLVESCEEAIHVPTYGGDTILHLAVKYNSFDTVEFLIDRVRDLNAKDNKGNTVLHLAVASKQQSVTKFLLSKAKIDVNSMNLKFSSPLDVLLESRPEFGDLVLGEMILAAGGKTAAENLSESEHVFRDRSTGSNSNLTAPPRTSLRRPHCSAIAKYDPEEATPKSRKEKQEKKMYHSDVLLLVATLVATVTFQGALNPPGGFQPDDDVHHKNHTAGEAVLGKYLSLFLVLDMFALFSSVSVILLFLCVVPRKRKIIIKLLVWVVWAAAFSMGMAFTAGIVQIYDFDDYISSKSADMLASGWFAVFRLGISWVLLKLLFFMLSKSGLWQLLLPKFAKLKAWFSSTWKRFNGRTKNNWSIKLFRFLKSVAWILSIMCVLGGIGLVWGSYKCPYFQ